MQTVTLFHMEGIATQPGRWGWNTPLLGRISGPNVRFWGILLVTLFSSLKHYFGPACPYPFPIAFVVGLMYTTGMWEGAHRIIMAMRKWKPDAKDTALRLVVQSTLIVAHVAGFKVVGSLLEIHIFNSGLTLEEEFWGGFFFALIVSIVVTVLYEAAYFFDEWRRSALRAERLQTEGALSQLEALKQQVDPHFLFNSLNTLAALIGDNPQAQRFLDQLCDVYRYVLLSKDRSTVPLTEELAFVQSYVYLNRIRHRDNLRFIADVPAPALGQVPPLALQLLVENALKHNVATADRPLTVRIWMPDADTIAVTNNLQPRVTLVPSTRLGLSNLRNRYALLSNAPVSMSSTETEFEVRVPLLQLPDAKPAKGVSATPVVIPIRKQVVTLS